MRAQGNIHCPRPSFATLLCEFPADDPVSGSFGIPREEKLPTETPRVQPASSGSMLRILGITFGIAVSLGSSIGSGIMRTPSQIASRMPSEWLIMSAWVLGAKQHA